MISASLILSKYLTMLLSEFPWATINTFYPFKIYGPISSNQYGKTLSTQSFKHSDKGNASLGTYW